MRVSGVLRGYKASAATIAINNERPKQLLFGECLMLIGSHQKVYKRAFYEN